MPRPARADHDMSVDGIRCATRSKEPTDVGRIDAVETVSGKVAGEFRTTSLYALLAATSLFWSGNHIVGRAIASRASGSGTGGSNGAVRENDISFLALTVGDQLGRFHSSPNVQHQPRVASYASAACCC